MVLLKDLVEEAKQKEREKRLEEQKQKRKEYYKKHYRRKKKKKKQRKRETGFSNLSRYQCKQCKNGYVWAYLYKGFEVRKVNFLELRRIILDLGFEWEITDRNEALKTSRIVGLPLYDLMKK